MGIFLFSSSPFLQKELDSKEKIVIGTFFLTNDFAKEKKKTRIIASLSFTQNVPKNSRSNVRQKDGFVIVELPSLYCAVFKVFPSCKKWIADFSRVSTRWGKEANALVSDGRVK